jgi:hypothetical protein
MWNNWKSVIIGNKEQNAYVKLREHRDELFATSRKVTGSIPDEVIKFLNWPNPSSRTMARGSTQPLTEMSTRNLSGCKGWLAHKAIAICEPTV